MDIGAACTIFQPAQYYCQDVNEKIKCTAFDSFEHRKIELTVTVACKRLMALRHQATFCKAWAVWDCFFIDIPIETLHFR